MPQMMPLPWLLLLILATTMILLIMMKSYFLPFLNKSSSINSKEKNSCHWMW
uniref:ATP synthase F0 subunit 8 n=1 Tax=Argulus japonicus TaxID=873553 RepID=A0A7I8F3W1_9CRUS|nr:ATP synthase F0 subunit 8 [Argulus japonicus]